MDRSEASVLPGVRVGKGAIMGAGAVVTRDVKPAQIVAGKPARVIAHRSCDPTYAVHYSPMFDTDVVI